MPLAEEKPRIFDGYCGGKMRWVEVLCAAKKKC
jgi:hypothetical protein